MRCTIKWRDLVLLRPYEIVLDLCLWIPWLLLAGFSVIYGIFSLAVLGWFFFFLTGLRLSHEAFHRNLGLPVFFCDLILFFLSPLMLSCLHSTRYTHLHHHRYCLGDEDIEGRVATYNVIQSIWQGLKYPFLSHQFAWNSNDSHTRTWMLRELIWIILIYSIGLYFFHFLFACHFIAMAIAEGLASFFAVWMVHHDCEDKKNPSRSIRGVWRGYLTYNMFYHYEHHCCPRVPTRNLPKLAMRLDALGTQKLPKAF